jgi:hypothetical protein
MQKSILKAALLAVLYVVLVLGLSTVALAAPPWSDMPDTLLAKYGVTADQVAAISEGYADGLWKPDQNVTRAQFIKMAVVAFKIPLANPATPSFTDVPKDNFYYQYIEGAKAAAVTSGVTATTFGPDVLITRQQALAIIARYAASANGQNLATMYSAEQVATLLAHFGDADMIADALRSAMAYAYDTAITLGNAQGNLDPLANLTRIQGATLLIRAGAKVPYVYVADGTTKITDAAFNPYFEGDALAGVKALLNAGKVYVNGLKVPATESETTLYQVNGIDSLWWNAGQSTWGYAVHKYVYNYGTPPLAGVTVLPMTFDVARLSFIETMSSKRGRTVTLTLDPATHQAVRIDITEMETVLIGGIETHGATTTINRTSFTLETGRYPARFDVNGVTFPTENVDTTIQVGDFAVWWLGPTGWNLERCVPVVGILTKDASNYYHINETDVRYEADCSRFNLATPNRPTQFFTAHTRLGLGNLPVTVWCMPDTGNPIGFTHGNYADSKAALALAITNATAAKTGVVVATDAASVPAGTKWVTQAAMDTFNAALAAAQAVYNDNASVLAAFDSAIYALSGALGVGGNTPSGFIGAQGVGTKQ